MYKIAYTTFIDKIKTELLTTEYANEEAKRINVTFIDSANSKGRIGSLGALLWANDGVEAAGLYGEQP